MSAPEQRQSRGDRHVRCFAGWVLMAMATTATGQSTSTSFAIPRQSIDGGSQRATSANFELNGSIGQADAGAVSISANFSIRGGFHRPVEPAGPPPDPLFANGFENY